MENFIGNAGKNISVKILSHVLIWSVLLIFPLLFTTSEEHQNSYIYLRTCLSLLFSAVIFYSNFFFIIQRLLFKKKILWFLLINLLLIFICVYGMQALQEAFGRDTQFRRPTSYPSASVAWKKFVLVRNAFSFLLTAGISVAIRATQQWIVSEAEKKNMENKNLASQLSHLRYQLQPHFFFNSLNAIYSLIDSAPEKAKDTVHTLGKMMRYVLYETKDEQISVSKEIEFLKSYIQLMRLRFSSQVEIESDFSNVPMNKVIAPLLLVPLVENAFKHGVSSLTRSIVKIGMKVDESNLIFYTENTNCPKNKEDASGSGVGLENLKQRLDLLYKNRFSFHQEVKEDIMFTTLTIQL